MVASPETCSVCYLLKIHAWRIYARKSIHCVRRKNCEEIETDMPIENDEILLIKMREINMDCSCWYSHVHRCCRPQCAQLEGRGIANGKHELLQLLALPTEDIKTIIKKHGVTKLTHLSALRVLKDPPTQYMYWVAAGCCTLINPLLLLGSLMARKIARRKKTTKDEEAQERRTALRGGMDIDL